MKNLILSLTILVFTMVSCNSNNPPDRNCPLETLFLDESEFPSGTVLQIINSPTSESTESGTRTYLLGNDSGIQGVFRFSYSRTAYRFFRLKRKTFFDESDITANDLYFDDHANRYYVACKDEYGLLCTMIAQYEEYFVFLSSDISETNLTLSIFLDLIKAIDSKMANCTGG